MTNPDNPVVAEVFFPPNAGLHEVYSYCDRHGINAGRQMEIHFRTAKVLSTGVKIKEVESIVIYENCLFCGYPVIYYDGWKCGCEET